MNFILRVLLVYNDNGSVQTLCTCLHRPIVFINQQYTKGEIHFINIHIIMYFYTGANMKYSCLWNTNAPLPQLIENRLDLWPTNLNIDRGHLLIKDYLPTKFEDSGAKHSWVISCTRWSRLAWPLTLTFDLLTWISIGIIYWSRTIYLPSLKLLGQSVLELSVAQG